MSETRRPVTISPLLGDLALLLLVALARVILHTLTNSQYGFHRDELATVDDARNLSWGYVAYPPLTPFLARVSLELFGASLVGVRVFATLAQAAAVVLGGWMARELGGRRPAQVVAALAVAIAPVCLAQGAVLQYVSFDYLWWVLAAWLTIRLLHTEDPRWWLAIGAVVGLGMMTKYTMAFLVAGIGAGLLLTPARRFLRSPWPWGGAAVALLIFLPNLIWQIRHDVISLEFLRHIHARDVRIGRTDSFLSDQLALDLFTIPLWVAGLVYFFFATRGRPYRLLGWMFAIPFVLFVVTKGRGFYMAAGYPKLLAAGAAVGERWVASLGVMWAWTVRVLTGFALLAGAAFAVAFIVPIAPVNSAWWKRVDKVNDQWREEVGWPDMVESVARVRDALPPEERGKVGILVGNYGEAGAINLFGPRHGLPRAISGTNSGWLRGYGDSPPQTLIVVGLSREYLERSFLSCELAGHNTNRYGVRNEETVDHPDIFLCRGLRQGWPEFWKHFRMFG